SFSMMNGETTQSMRYTYYMMARNIGSFSIPSATIKVGKEKLRTEPIAIKVLENLDKNKSKDDDEQEEQSFDPFKGFRDPFEQLRKVQPKQKEEDSAPVEKPTKPRKTYKTEA
ncbi:MAG: BatD like domain, partial [Bacteroidota bacterium]